MAFNGPVCAECNHPWSAHLKMIGCSADWEYNEQGIATVDGCECQLVHVTESPVE